MPLNRTVTFHPSTNPPAEQTHIRIIPNTEIHLRHSKTWIPVQIFDLITDHLTHTHSHIQARDLNPTPPYKDLIHTLSFITAYPITSSLISEIQALPPLLRHHPKTRAPKAKTAAAEDDDQKADLWRTFDKMHHKWISLQRQRVSTTQQLDPPITKTTDRVLRAGIPWNPPLPATLRERKNAEALLVAQRKARLLQLEEEVGWGRSLD